ncbi:plasmid stability protein StbB, partial [Pseudomonas savastanoi pv. fraxini]|uniref:PIN domain-containing protein n=1 Tax=Pseudomonas savastanoi TaxID=29438 RepID=UPI0007608E36
LRAGIALMPVGKRQDSLRENLEKHLLPMFANRVLSFDMTCTKAYAELLAKSRAAGLAVETADAFIAAIAIAIAIANGFTVATRDTGPFEAAGLNVINPWEA